MNSPDRSVRRFVHAGFLVLAACDASDNKPRKLEATDSVAAAVVGQMSVRGDSASPKMAIPDSGQGTPRADSRRLNAPRILRDFCEGEGCMFPYSIVACSTLTLRSADADDAREVGRINIGDTAVVETGNLHLNAPGLAVLRRDHAVVHETSLSDGMVSYDTVQLVRGDTVLIWENQGEGYWGVEHKGRRMTVEEFWSGPASIVSSRYEDQEPAVSLSKPDAISWGRLRLRDGRTGWSRRELYSAVIVVPDWPYGCEPGPR
jgi:hypothetical protein